MVGLEDSETSTSCMSHKCSTAELQPNFILFSKTYVTLKGLEPLCLLSRRSSTVSVYQFQHRAISQLVSCLLCPRWDSNPHAQRQLLLRKPCLPFHHLDKRASEEDFCAGSETRTHNPIETRS